MSKEVVKKIMICEMPTPNMCYQKIKANLNIVKTNLPVTKNAENKRCMHVVKFP